MYYKYDYPIISLISSIVGFYLIGSSSIYETSRIGWGIFLSLVAFVSSIVSICSRQYAKSFALISFGICIVSFFCYNSNFGGTNILEVLGVKDNTVVVSSDNLLNSSSSLTSSSSNSSTLSSNTSSSKKKSSISNYQQVYNEYSAKIKSASTIDDMANFWAEGCEKFAIYLYYGATGTDAEYNTYQEWVDKLTDVYFDSGMEIQLEEYSY